MSEHPPGVLVTELTGGALASLIARRGCLDTLRAVIREHYAAELPLTPRVVEAEGGSFMWAGPERWLVTAPARPPHDLVASLRARTDGIAAVCDQSDSRILLRVSGPLARETLARGISLDLHPSVFTPGSTAITIVAHMGCQIWQMDDTPTYVLATPTSLAESFCRWLAAAMAEFGGHFSGTVPAM